MRSGLLLGFGLLLVVGALILATTWHSWVSWDFAISIRGISRTETALYLGGLVVVAVVLIWRWVRSRPA